MLYFAVFLLCIYCFIGGWLAAYWHTRELRIKGGYWKEKMEEPIKNTLREGEL